MLKTLRHIAIASVLLTASAHAAETVQAPEASNTSLEKAHENYKKEDFQSAFNELLPLAQAGNARAQYAIGYLYYYGKGVTRNTKLAEDWISKAAAQHYTPAEQALTLMKKATTPATETPTDPVKIAQTAITPSTEQTITAAQPATPTLAQPITPTTDNKTVTQAMPSAPIDNQALPAQPSDQMAPTQTITSETTQPTTAQTTSTPTVTPSTQPTAAAPADKSAAQLATAAPTDKPALAQATPLAPTDNKPAAIDNQSIPATQSSPATSASNVQAPNQSAIESSITATNTQAVTQPTQVASENPATADTVTAVQPEKVIELPSPKVGLSKDISQLPAKHLTIQLFGSSDEKEVIRFLNKHGLKAAPTYLVKIAKEGETRYILTYGNYKSQKEAKKALNKLNAKLRQHGAWIKTFGSLQHELQK